MGQGQWSPKWRFGSLHPPGWRPRTQTQDPPLLTGDPGPSFVTQFPLFAKGQSTAYDTCFPEGPASCMAAPPPAVPDPQPPELLHSQLAHGSPNVLQFRPQAPGPQDVSVRGAAWPPAHHDPSPTSTASVGFSGSHGGWGREAPARPVSRQEHGHARWASLGG